MKITQPQVNALAAATMDRARRECIIGLRQKGFTVSEDPVGAALIVGDATGNSARVETLGLIARVTSAEGRTTEFEQFPGGRVRRIKDPSGREVHFERDGEGFLHSIHRGPGGGTYGFKLSQDWKPLRITYPDGTASVAEYSATGQPSRIIQRDGTEVRYEYSPDDRLISLIDPKGNRTRLSNQGSGVSRAIDYPNGDHHAYVQDVDAHLLRFGVNGKSHAQYQYDSKRKSIGAEYHDGSNERFVFSNGRLVEAANEHSTVKFQYDDAGRLISEDAGGRIVRYLRNEVGSLVGIVTPEGETISYTRDRDQRLTGITDWDGDRYETLLPAAGPPSEIRYPNGLTVATKTNPMGLPSTWSVCRSAGPSGQVDAATWEHDTCDRLVAATRDSQRREYRYSKVSRLVEVLCSDHKLSEQFELDSCGNRVQSNGARCTYDPMNRLLQEGNREFLYDGLGNQTSNREGEKTSTYTYNGRGQLITIKTPELVAHYAYDALGRRIRKRIGSVTTHFQWAGTQLLSESTDDGKQATRRDYLFCPEFLTPLAFRENSSVYYIHQGRLQEPLCVTDRGGQVVWKAEYRAFGSALVSVERVRQRLRLPGQYYDAETGLHYAVARYYAPDLGRFLSMDPHRLPGASLNYYTYCDGDPVNRIDPTGEISLTLGTVLVAVAVGAVVGAAIGAGVELYKQRNQEQIDWGQVGTAAVIGGCLGGIGAAVGAVAGAATLGALGVLGAGAAAGGLGAAVVYCVQAAGKGEWNWSEFGTAVATGAAIGAVTAGIGGLIAARGGAGAGAITEEGAAGGVVEGEGVAGGAALKEAPAPGSLTDIEARDWYTAKISEIDAVEQQMRADGKSSKEIFEATTELRNDAKLQARDLMQNQELAKSLPPPKTPEEVLEKYGGDYDKAIEASKRTNPDVNQTIEDRRATGEK